MQILKKKSFANDAIYVDTTRTFTLQNEVAILWVALFDMPNLNRFDILSISIFCKIALSISISISIFSKITISISISISIFLELPYRYRYFSELPYRYRYRYRYRYFSKVSIYRQSIYHIDISNRATKQCIDDCHFGRRCQGKGTWNKNPCSQCNGHGQANHRKKVLSLVVRISE